MTIGKKSIHEYLNIRLILARSNNWKQYIFQHRKGYSVGMQRNFTVIRNDLLAINMYLEMINSWCLLKTAKLKMIPMVQSQPCMTL